MNFRYFRTVSFRITFWISLVVCAIVLLHLWIIQPKARFYEQKILESDRLARVIEAHLLAEMVSGSLDNVQNHLEFLPAHKGIHRVEIIDVDSRVRFSSDPSRLGKEVAREREAPCLHCHARDEPPPPRILYDLEGVGKVFAVDHLLKNGGRCVECHENDGPVLGNLLVEVSLSELDLEILRTNRSLMTMGAGLLVVLLIGIGMIIQHFVGHPVTQLVSKMNRIEEGDLDIEVTGGSKDEFGYLEKAFRNMVHKLRDVYAKMERTIEERTRTLYETQAQVVHQEKLVGIGQLAAGVAHEIGNPLTAIDSLAQLLALENKDPAALEKIKMIQSQVGRITEIVHNMADLSRPLSLTKNPVGINSVVRSMLGLARYDARFTAVKIETDLDNNLPDVVTVEDRLFSVFLNLALNAADAMGGRGVLEIVTSREDDHLGIAFHDSGEGIPEENIDRIFDPYFTTKEAGRGTGLGLSVCRTALREIGGEISVKSVVGKGSTFLVRIPIDPEKGEEAGGGR